MQKEFLGLRTVIYFVPDIEKAKQWYTEAFSTAPYFDTPFYVGYNVGGYELGLHPGDKNETGKTGNTITYWGVNDVQASYERLLLLGAGSFEPAQDVGEGIIVAAVKDPWENIIGMISNPHFKEE